MRSTKLPVGAGIADHLPRSLVPIAAIGWIAKEAFHHVLIQQVEKETGRERAGIDLSCAKTVQDFITLIFRDRREVFAVCLGAVRVDRRDGGAIGLRRREANLPALLREARMPQALHEHLAALTEAAGQLLIDEIGDAEVDTVGTQIICWNHMIDRGFDPTGFIRVEKSVSASFRLCGRCCRSWCCCLRNLLFLPSASHVVRMQVVERLIRQLRWQRR